MAIEFSSQMRRRWRLAVSLAAALGIGACSLYTRAPEIPAEATFAAYRTDDGLRIQRMAGGAPGWVEDADCGLLCSGPQLLLQSGDETEAAFWVHATRTVIRRATDASSPRLGEIEVSWESASAAVRFSLRPEGDGAFETGSFERVDGGFAQLALGQSPGLTVDLSGVYLAEIVDRSGGPGGWLRVRIAPRESPSRIYVGVLPESVSGPLAAAVVARLDAVIDGVLAKATNPYLGN